MCRGGKFSRSSICSDPQNSYRHRFLQAPYSSIPQCDLKSRIAATVPVLHLHSRQQDRRRNKEKYIFLFRCQRTSPVSRKRKRRPGDCSMTYLPGHTNSEEAGEMLSLLFPQLNRESPVHVEGWGSTYWGTFSYLYLWLPHTFLCHMSYPGLKTFQCIISMSKQWLVIIFLKDEYLYTVKKFLNHEKNIKIIHDSEPKDKYWNSII